MHYIKFVIVLFSLVGSLSYAQTLTETQQKVANKASEYLDQQAYSRTALIKKLAAADFNITDTTKAVDSLNIDWDLQALRSAKQYLSKNPMAYYDLIKILSSPSGDQFTDVQANYGARESGVCMVPEIQVIPLPLPGEVSNN